MLRSIELAEKGEWRARDISSPEAVASMVSYLLNNSHINPLASPQLV